MDCIYECYLIQFIGICHPDVHNGGYAIRNIPGDWWGQVPISLSEMNNFGKNLFGGGTCPQ